MPQSQQRRHGSASSERACAVRLPVAVLPEDEARSLRRPPPRPSAAARRRRRRPAEGRGCGGARGGGRGGEGPELGRVPECLGQECQLLGACILTPHRHIAALGNRGQHGASLDQRAPTHVHDPPGLQKRQTVQLSTRPSGADTCGARAHVWQATSAGRVLPSAGSQASGGRTTNACVARGRPAHGRRNEPDAYNLRLGTERIAGGTVPRRNKAARGVHESLNDRADPFAQWLAELRSLAAVQQVRAHMPTALLWLSEGASPNPQLVCHSRHKVAGAEAQADRSATGHKRCRSGTQRNAMCAPKSKGFGLSLARGRLDGRPTPASPEQHRRGAAVEDVGGQGGAVRVPRESTSTCSLGQTLQPPQGGA
mmetsp:Transcript_16931/g.59144  ORF Transcript_16931/g.59144 Transcript_16931/m.59144 type:complete len:368 (-) Transcript_16931:7-1110(-)